MEIKNHYPLVWPVGVSRTKARITGKGSPKWSEVVGELSRIARLYDCTEVAISSDYDDGKLQGTDSGICVKIIRHGMIYYVACDRYWSCTHNLKAIVSILDAYRKIDGSGVRIVKIEK